MPTLIIFTTMKKKLVILGSTGSIGENSLRVCQNLKNSIQVIGLAARSKLDRLVEQAHQFRPQWVSVTTKQDAKKISSLLPKGCRVLTNGAELNQAVTDNSVHMVLCAIVGTAGFEPVLHAIRSHKDIALASKEILVMAGELIMQEVKQNQIHLLPVDSEHSAIFQCLEGRPQNELSKIILTASGGPFYQKPKSEFPQITLQQALKHPTWSMGHKVTIDSATLMNKGLELIEAAHLFQVTQNQLEVVIHPQSIVHSLVEFNDRCLLAQLGNPDMCLPIQYAFTWPKRQPSLLAPLNLAQIGHLDFFTPDEKKFPSLSFAREAIAQGGTLPAVFNAANEVAVERFVKNNCRFIDIFTIVEKAMAHHVNTPATSLSAIYEADFQARQFSQQIILPHYS